MTLESSRFRIHLCGPLVIERGERRLDRQMPGRQGRLLFAYLVCNRHRPTRRSDLIDAIWSDHVPPATDNALNALISKLRHVVGPDAVDGRANLRLQLGDAWVDIEAAVEAVHRAESAIAVRDWRRAWGPALVALFTSEREFLPSDEAPWIESQRVRLADIHLRALEAYAVCCLRIGGTELAAGVRAGRQLVHLAPLRETGYQLLMQALASQGNVAEALRVYTNLCEVLRDELGVTPCAASRAVHDQLIIA